MNAHESAPFSPLKRAWKRIASFEFSTLLTLALIIGAVWILAELTDEVVEGSTHAFDRSVILSLRASEDLSDPVGPEWLEEMARDATALGGVLVAVLATAGVAVFLLMRGRKFPALFLVTSVALGLTISTIYKMVIDRPRPDLVPHGSIVHSASFPSGHSMMSAMIFFTIAAILMRAEPSKRVKTYLLLLAMALCVLVGVSRVYLGVHWPTDVLAGWTAGIGWAVVSYVIGRRIGWIAGEHEPDDPQTVRAHSHKQHQHMVAEEVM